MMPPIKNPMLLAKDHFQALLDHRLAVLATGAADDDFEDIAKLSEKICMALDVDRYRQEAQTLR